MLFMQLDNFFVGTLVGLTALGFYDRAFNTAQWPGTLCNSILSRSVFYIYARLQNDTKKLATASSVITWLVTNISLPMALLIFISAPDLIVLLYGERWLPSAAFLRILVVYAAFRPLWENASAFLIAIGKPRVTTILGVIQLALLVIVGLPLTLIWGATGTCFAVGIAFGPGLILAYNEMRLFAAMELWNAIYLPSLISLLSAVVYFYIESFSVFDGYNLYVRVALKALYAVALYSFLTCLIQPVNTRDKIRYLYSLLSQFRKG
jgi:O-antigen/teichoic acid export membrane protein